LKYNFKQLSIGPAYGKEKNGRGSSQDLTYVAFRYSRSEEENP